MRSSPLSMGGGVPGDHRRVGCRSCVVPEVRAMDVHTAVDDPSRWALLWQHGVLSGPGGTVGVQSISLQVFNVLWILYLEAKETQNKRCRLQGRLGPLFGRLRHSAGTVLLGRCCSGAGSCTPHALHIPAPSCPA